MLGSHNGKDQYESRELSISNRVYTIASCRLKENSWTSTLLYYMPIWLYYTQTVGKCQPTIQFPFEVGLLAMMICT